MAFSKSENERVRILCYLVIGGTAAITRFEWALVYLFAVRLGLNYLLSTGLAYLCSTVCHYIATNLAQYGEWRPLQQKKVFLVLIVSTLGLLLNLLLMRLFVGALGGSVMPSKILASALVTIWNYLSRKKWIYS